MRIFLHQYPLLADDLAAGFAALGHEVTLGGTLRPDGVVQPDPHALWNAAQGGADRIVLINGVGLDEEGRIARELAARDARVAWWFVDDPEEPFAAWDLHGPRAGGRECLGAPGARWFVMEESWRRPLAALGAPRIEWLPLAYSPRVGKVEDGSQQAEVGSRKAEGGSEEKDSRTGVLLLTSDFHLPTSDFPLPTSDFPLPTSDFPPEPCEVLVVATLQQRQAAELWEGFVRPRFGAWEGLCREIVELLVARPAVPADLVVAREFLRAGAPLPPARDPDRRRLTVALRRTATSRLRARVAAALAARFDTRIIGDDDWRSVVDPAMLRPRVPYGPALGAWYRAARVVVNVNNLQLLHGVNQRVFDVPAAGGRVITEPKSDLARLFGAEAPPTYATLAELETRVAAALADPAAHEARPPLRSGRGGAAALSARVRREHHFAARAAALLAAFEA